MSMTDICKELIGFFNREKMDFGIIGAFALYAFGYIRATKDIDFIARIENQKKVVAYLESLGFQTTNCTNAFSNHLHPIGAVRVDMMYVEGTTANEIFRTTEKKVIYEDLVAPVVSPEHFIAMKLFAIHCNPQRRLKDLSDIKEIMARSNCDREFVRKYFKKYGQEDEYVKIINEIG
jgi:hypothetical protein